MANRRVTIWRYAKTDGTWKYHKPTYGRNNKIKPEDGTYYIRWRNGKKMEWQRCHNAANAEEACRRREAMLTAQAYGIVPLQAIHPIYPVLHHQHCRWRIRSRRGSMNTILAIAQSHMRL